MRVARLLSFSTLLACLACSDPSGAPKLSSSAAGSSADLPVLTVPHLGATGVSISIDGVLGEAAWSGAADTGPFVDVARGGPAPPDGVRGRARVLYDDSYLYVGMQVIDAKIRGGFPAGAEDPHLWERDTTEIMIDPDGDGDNRDYYEIQISPQNLVFDSRFDAYNAPRGGPGGPFGHQEWRAALTSAVHLDGTIDDDTDRDQGYVVELKIPWTAFDKARVVPPHPGDEWRVNFYAMQDNGGTAWSPIHGQGNFHKASRFGRLRFGPET